MTDITDDLVLKAARAQHPDVWNPEDGLLWPNVPKVKVDLTLEKVRRGLEAVLAPKPRLSPLERARAHAHGIKTDGPHMSWPEVASILETALADTEQLCEAREAEVNEVRAGAGAEITRLTTALAQARRELSAIRRGDAGSISLETLGRLNEAAGLNHKSSPVDPALDVLDGLVGAFYDVFGKRR